MNARLSDIYVKAGAGLEAQICELQRRRRIGITEQVSSVAPRKALEEAIDYARECDARLQAKSIDTGAPTGKLMLNLLGSIAEFERGVMLMANIGARTRAA